MKELTIGNKPFPVEDQIAIKVRVESGCFHREHSPEAYAIIDKEIYALSVGEQSFDFIEHESGPEIIAWVALGTAGLTLAKSVIDLVTAIINARTKGRIKGDRPQGKLLLVVREKYKTNTSTEDIVLEIYDNELVTTEQIKSAIEKGLQKRNKRT